MLPTTLLSAQKVADLLNTNSALQQVLTALNAQYSMNVPLIPNENVVLSSASADLADRSVQLSYPRICLYASGLKNSQLEKYRPLSGHVSLILDILSSADLVDDTDQWIHYYVEAVTELLRRNIGDWGDGVFFAGQYDVQLQAPKAGGFGFVQLARVTLSLLVSGN